jgi:DNA-binding transcriptional MerR regulator
MFKSPDNTVSIGDASRLTGVSQKQLRYWEGRYINDPKRSVCGERAYRRYSREDIQKIIKIKEYMEEGFTLQSAAARADRSISR